MIFYFEKIFLCGLSDRFTEEKQSSNGFGLCVSRLFFVSPFFIVDIVYFSRFFCDCLIIYGHFCEILKVNLTQHVNKMNIMKVNEMN